MIEITCETNELHWMCSVANARGQRALDIGPVLRVGGVVCVPVESVLAVVGEYEQVLITAAWDDRNFILKTVEGVVLGTFGLRA